MRLWFSGCRYNIVTALNPLSVQRGPRGVVRSIAWTPDKINLYVRHRCTVAVKNNDREGTSSI